MGNGKKYSVLMGCYCGKKNGQNNNMAKLHGITENIAASWVDSNRDGIPCNYFLIGQDIDLDYRNYLIYNLLIKI